jgi:hypothetical protein
MDLIFVLELHLPSILAKSCLPFLTLGDRILLSCFQTTKNCSVSCSSSCYLSAHLTTTWEYQIVREDDHIRISILHPIIVDRVWTAHEFDVFISHRKLLGCMCRQRNLCKMIEDMIS